MKITVTGSLGNISEPLVKKLVERGHKVTVISRSEKRKKEIDDLGASAAIGALEDAEFLAATCAGADAVFLMVPANFDVSDMRDYYRKIGHSYVKAVQKTKVNRLVYLSSCGADLDHGTGFVLGTRDMEVLLNKLQNVALTHLRPGYFYVNLYNFIDSIKEKGYMASNYGGGTENVLVSPKDIATAATEELEKQNGDDIRYVVSEEMTADEAAKILGEAIGKPDLELRLISDEEAQKALEESGMPSHIAKLFVDLGRSIRNDKLGEDYYNKKPIKLGSTKLHDFATEFSAAYENANWVCEWTKSNVLPRVYT